MRPLARLRADLTVAVVICAVFVCLFAVTACGVGQPEHTVYVSDYMPPTFGDPAAHRCYYVDDPGEVDRLHAAHLCDPGWQPYLAPTSWRDRYYDYLTSDAYVVHYVPARVQARYRTDQATYYRVNRVRVMRAERDPATPYRTRDGKTTTAGKIGVTKFGGGPASRKMFGTGSAVRCSGSVVRAWMRAGSGSSGGSSGGSRSSFGGGSASRSSSSRSTSGGGGRPRSDGWGGSSSSSSSKSSSKSVTKTRSGGC